MARQVKVLAAKLIAGVQVCDPHREGGEPTPVVCPLIQVTRCMHTHAHRHAYAHTQHIHTHTHTQGEGWGEREIKY